MQRIFQQLIFLFFLFSSGCVNPFAPGLDESPDGNFGLITDQKTVDGVLQNFKYAYTFRDSTLYGKTLANNFLFCIKITIKVLMFLGTR